MKELGQSQTEVASSCLDSVLEITTRADSQKDCHIAASITPADDIIHSFNKSLFNSVQSLSPVWLFVTPWTAAHQASHYQVLLPTPGACSNSCPLSHPTISSSRPLVLPLSIFPGIRVFFNESVLCIRWPKYWSFSFSISPSNEYSGLISFMCVGLLLNMMLSKGGESVCVQREVGFNEDGYVPISVALKFKLRVQKWSISCHINKQGCHKSSEDCRSPGHPGRRTIPAIQQPSGCSHSLQWALRENTGCWPQMLRCLWKEWFQWAQTPASSHTEKSTKFLHLENLVFFNSQ